MCSASCSSRASAGLDPSTSSASPACLSRVSNCLQDADKQETCDTVDGAPDHQLNLSRERLDELIGLPSAAALWSLPAAFDGTVAAEDAKGAQIFIRHYSPEGRPWNPFHTDSSAMTINVALSGTPAVQRR